MWTDDLDHYISTKKLVELLNDIPKNTIVAPNAVGNLSVHEAETMKQIGHIDLGSEEVEIY